MSRLLRLILCTSISLNENACELHFVTYILKNIENENMHFTYRVSVGGQSTSLV